MSGFDNLFNGSAGRIGRQTYWISVVGLLLVGGLLNQLPLFGPVLALALLWPSSCVLAKRLHDTGRSAVPAAVVATLCLFMGLFNIGLGLAATVPVYAVAAFQLAVLAMVGTGLLGLAALALLLWAGLTPSDPDANRFGLPEAEPLCLSDLFAGRG